MREVRVRRQKQKNHNVSTTQLKLVSDIQVMKQRRCMFLESTRTPQAWMQFHLHVQALLYLREIWAGKFTLHQRRLCKNTGNTCENHPKSRTGSVSKIHDTKFERFIQIWQDIQIKLCTCKLQVVLFVVTLPNWERLIVPTRDGREGRPEMEGVDGACATSTIVSQPTRTRARNRSTRHGLQNRLQTNEERVKSS